MSMKISSVNAIRFYLTFNLENRTNVRKRTEKDGDARYAANLLQLVFGVRYETQIWIVLFARP